ncbi:hypothetical protein ABPG74_004266 [Tetrahymena malaccensis]
MSQIKTLPLLISVREQENPFSQTVNFQISLLSPNQTEISILQNKQNIYEVIQQNQGNLVYKNLEQYIVGSELKLNIIQQSTKDIQTTFSINQQLSQISFGTFQTNSLLRMVVTYLDNIFVAIYQNQGRHDIFLLGCANFENKKLQFEVLDQANYEQGEIIIDENGIVCVINFEKFDVLIPILNTQSQKYEFGYFNQQNKNITNMLSDPINNYLFFQSYNLVLIYKYQFQSKNNFQILSQIYISQFESDQIYNIKCNHQYNLLYSTNNYLIKSFNYLRSFFSYNIKVPDGLKEETSRNVVLFYTCFTVFRQYADKTFEINIYSYNDQNYKLIDSIDPQYLRSLNGQGYMLQISNPSLIQTSSNVFNMQEYIAIPAINSNNDSVILIFRISQVSSQNQLYCSIPVEPNSFNISFFGNKFIGFINTNSQKLQFYQFSYFLYISMDYVIQEQSFNQDFLFSTSAQVLISSDQTNMLRMIQEKMKMNFYFKFQKNLISQQGYINKQSDEVQSLLNYYDSQNLKVNDVYYFNDTNVYYGNFLGWQITQSLNQIDLQIYLQNSLKNLDKNGMNAYDIIIFGEIITMTYQNKLIFQNLFSIDLGENLDQCYLQTDESSIQITQDPITNKNIIRQTFFTLCLKKQNQFIQYFNKITVQQQPQRYSQDPEIKLISNQQWISNSIQFDRNTQILNKISNDPNLGLIASIQYLQYIGQSICQIFISEQEQGPFSFDCSVYEKLRFLKIVYFMWSYQCQSNIFFTLDGLAYYQISKTFDQFLVVNIKDMLINLNQNIDYGNIVTKVYSISQTDQTKIILSFNNFQIFEIQIIFNKKLKFEKIVCNEYFSEPNYIFQGFASQSNDLSQTILVMKDTQDQQNLIFFYYQSGQQPKTIKNSFKYEIIQQSQLNGQMKIFFKEQNCYFFMNRKDDQIGSIQQLSYTGQTEIIVRSFSNKNNFDSIGFYLTPIGVFSNKQATLPVQVRINSKNTFSKKIKLILLLQLFLIIFM